MKSALRLLLAALLLAVSGCAGGAPPWTPDAGATVYKESAHSVQDTLDRLAAAAPARGATVEGPSPTALDGAAADRTLLVSLPELEAAIVAAGPRAGVELPVRMRVWEDGGSVFLSYPAPSGIARRAGLAPDAPIVDRLSAALDALSDEAVAP